MKKHLFISLLALIIYVTPSFSQSYLEVKIRPLPFLAKMPNIEMEYNFNENYAISLRGAYLFDNQRFLSNNFGTTSYYTDLNFKYYAAPKLGADGIYGAIHSRYQFLFSEIEAIGLTETIQINRFVLGVNSGYKWVSNKYLSIDMGLGIGRALHTKVIRSDNIIPTGVIIMPLKIDFIGQLAIGYRFSLD